MGKKGISQVQKEQLAQIIQAARHGHRKYRWLDRIIRDSGYARVAKEKGHRLYITATELADSLGVSIRTVRTWCSEGLSPREECKGPHPGLFDVFDVLQYLMRRQEAKLTKPKEKTDLGQLISVLRGQTQDTDSEQEAMA